MTTILNYDDAANSNRPPQTPRVRQPLWIQRVVVIIGMLFLSAGATMTLAQGPSPSPSPGISPSPSPGISPSPSPGISPSPSPGPSCSPIANASMSISGGGGPFNPTSLTINPGTRVTWTNIGNNRARVRDVNHILFDSGDLEPGQTFSFTFCVSGSFGIEDARSSASAIIFVTGVGPSPSPGTSPSPSPGTSPSPSPGTSPSPSPGTSPSPSPGTSPSPSPGISPPPSPSPAAQPLNISTRVRVETGEGVMIGGFIITGNEPKRVIIRGIGPSMTSVGVQGAINDPILRLFGPTGSSIAVNDNWQDTQGNEIQLTGLAPQDVREAAIIATLPPANYTATVADATGSNGVGLVEIYDLNSGANARLGNISTRGSVQTAENVMIGGFVLGGASINPARIVVRALGPSLQSAGIADPLSNPTLQLFDSNGQIVLNNDNWQDVPSQAAELQALNLAPPNPAESAVVAMLSPGLYTAVVAGRNGETGIGLIEVYGVQ